MQASIIKDTTRTEILSYEIKIDIETHLNDCSVWHY